MRLHWWLWVILQNTVPSMKPTSCAQVIPRDLDERLGVPGLVPGAWAWYMTCQPTVDGMSANSRWYVSQQSMIRQPTVDDTSANSR